MIFPNFKLKNSNIIVAHHTINQLDSCLAEDNDKIIEAEIDAPIAEDNGDRISLVYQTAKEQFKNGIETRQIMTHAAGVKELETHTSKLNSLQQRELTARQVYRESQQKLSELRDMQQKASLDVAKDKAQLEAKAFQEYSRAMQFSALKVFLLRFCVTLPLLIIGGGLFVKKRKSACWPFVWGVIVFALFAFFVELVSYLPSYGGYICALAGVIFLLLLELELCGLYTIISTNRKKAKCSRKKSGGRKFSTTKHFHNLDKAFVPAANVTLI